MNKTNDQHKPMKTIYLTFCIDYEEGLENFMRAFEDAEDAAAFCEKQENKDENKDYDFKIRAVNLF